MAYQGNLYGDITTRVGVVAVAKFLAHAQNEMFLEQYAMQEMIPQNKGQTLKWKRAIPLQVSAVALTEGVTKAPKMYEDEPVQVSISQYGEWMGLTDVIADTHEDPVLNKMTEVLGQQAGATKELIIWNAISAGTQAIYTNGTARIDVNTPITSDDLRAAVRQLKLNRGKKITKRIPASTDIATEPVNAGYVYFGNTAQQRDFEEMDGFVPCYKYAGYSPISEWEIGSVANGEVRVVLTNHAVPDYGAGSATLNGMLNNVSNVDVYLGVLFAQDAFGAASLKGRNAATISVVNPKVTVEDPHGQRGIVSWKFWYAALILNQNWIIRIEAACTDL